MYTSIYFSLSAVEWGEPVIMPSQEMITMPTGRRVVVTPPQLKAEIQWQCGPML